MLPILCIPVVVLYSTVSFSAASPGLTIELKDNELAIEAKAVSLGQMIISIKRELSIVIEGLAAKQDLPITFTARASSPDLLIRRLLLHLGEKNYAFEYD